MSDTIAAVSTPMLPSAIGILRLSGENAIGIASRAFRPKNGAVLEVAPNRKLILGELFGADGVLLDVCLATISRAPNTYTGEDTAEFHCHGSPIVLGEALRTVFGHGARQALPGEFTKRAFLNGRLDLTRAEAIADLIDAETSGAAQNAAGQLSGAVETRINIIYSSLLDIMSHFHAVIDYPDEDISPFESDNTIRILNSAESDLHRLIGTFERGRILKGGIKCAIIGRPNAGKSTLLNALLGYERAIVTSVPGTTRDTIEERIKLGGLVLRLTDTAGLRKTDDAVESIGVERTYSAAESADLVLAVFDESEPLKNEDRETLLVASRAKNAIAVINKTDLPPVAETGEIERSLGKPCRISALKQDGLSELENRIAALFPTGDNPIGEIITNERQANAVSNSLEAVKAAKEGLSSGITPDAVLTEVETALGFLGEITGRTIREDIIGRIFERFCVGK